MPDFQSQRLTMVATQILANGVTDERILAAFRSVPRELFVTGAQRAIAYSDSPLRISHGRDLLEPRTLAKFLQFADIQPTDRVLDVGCATGYSTALIARLAGQVVGLEQDADFVRVASDTVPVADVRNATIVQGVLSEGHRKMAPYNVIVVEGGIEAEPSTLLAQLADGGRLVAIAQKGADGHGVLFQNEQGRIGRRVIFDASAQILLGFRQAVGFVF
jgi:protein-L-isoaspartate(D-aspartate) O-methyltransferase